MGLAVIELAGLGIHALDHIDFATRSQIRQNQMQVFSIYRTVAETAPANRADALDDLHIPSGTTALLLTEHDPLIPSHKMPLPDFPGAMFNRFHPPPGNNGMEFGPHPGPEGEIGEPGAPMGPFPPGMMNGGGPYHPGEIPEGPGGPFRGEQRIPMRHMMPPMMDWGLLPSSLYPRAVWTGQKLRTHSVSLLLPDKRTWLVVRFVTPLPNPFGSPTFLIAFLLMSLCGSALIVWGSRRLVAPVTTLANAAESLGRNVNTAALPENGPSEIRRAAIAFNTMASRIRRFITDRTLMLTAIGHDLRTPITRLKLRAEFIDDDELRTKILSDLDEMEAMVDATLAFGRDSASNEPVVTLDLRALLQTIMDEAAESQPDMAEALIFEPPTVPVKVRARSVALKRALNNLILNALKYGRSAQVTLEPAAMMNTASGVENLIKVVIEDSGPGLADDQLERVFEPFVRVETSRNRETGGTGLGLSIARTILRAQGGDVRLENRREGGLRAVVTLAP